MTTNEIMKVAYDYAMYCQEINHNSFSTNEIIEGIQWDVYLLEDAEVEEIKEFLDREDLEDYLEYEEVRNFFVALIKRIKELESSN